MMAVGQPQPSFVLYVDDNENRSAKLQSSRRSYVAGILLLAMMCAVIALVGFGSPAQTEMVVKVAATAPAPAKHAEMSPSTPYAFTALEQKIVNAAPDASVDQLMQDLSSWRSKVFSSENLLAANQKEMLSMLPMTQLGDACASGESVTETTSDDFASMVNVAAQERGGVPFGSGSLPGYCTNDNSGMGVGFGGEGIHCFDNINDGISGNTNSWIPGPNTADGGKRFAGVKFLASETIYGVSLSRDAAGRYNDRTGGTFTLEYSTDPNVDQNGWCTAGTFTRSDGKEHFYKLAVPVQAAAIRLVVSDENTCIDELQVYAKNTDGKLCPKKEVIIAKLDALLKKLMAANTARSSADNAAFEAKEAAAKASMDAEAEYRLQLSKIKQAKEGGAFARGEYEKWAAVLKDLQNEIAVNEAGHAQEKIDVSAERALINEVLRLIGVLHAVPATAQYRRVALGCFKDSAQRSLPELSTVSASPAGVDSCEQLTKTKGYTGFCMENNNECFMGPDFMRYKVQGTADNCADGRGGGWALDCYNIREMDDQSAPSVYKAVEQRVAELKQAAMKPGSGLKVAQVEMLSSKLAVYQETDEVKAILEQMLKDLEDRIKVIVDEDAKARAQETEVKAKLSKYEKDLVDLSNAQDKAQEATDALALVREKLAAQKVATALEYTDEHADYDLTYPLANREIEIIQTIIKKVEDFCAEKTTTTEKTLTTA
jgi:hypothetical protein